MQIKNENIKQNKRKRDILMEQNFGIGIDDFKRFRSLDNIFYIDKSLFIKEIIDCSDAAILITRPRRFGKSLALSMVKYYFDITEDSKELFKGLKIMDAGEKYTNLMNKYPVILVSFKEIKAESYDEFMESIKDYLSELFMEYSFLLESEKVHQIHKEKIKDYQNKQISIVDIKRFIKFLSHILEKYYSKPVIIIIDEYDAPFNKADENGFSDRITDLFGMIIENTFKGNPYMKKGILMGVNQIAKESIYSAANNIIAYNVLENRFSSSFGFLEEEIKCILETYEMTEYFDEIKHWYDGYTIGNIDNIYNPWSVINFLSRNDKGFVAHWINSGSLKLVKLLIENSSINTKNKVLELIKGNQITEKINFQKSISDVKKNEDSIWSLLLSAGYLKAVSAFNSQREIYNLKIPNREIKIYYEDILIEWFQTNFDGEKVKKLLDLLISKNFKEFKEKLSEYIILISSFKDAKDGESFYHAFFLGITMFLIDTYIVRSNRESGFGLYDICLEPRRKEKPAFIIEFKSVKNNTLEKAIEIGEKQIIDRKYETDLKDREYKDITKLVIAFKSKMVYLKVLD